MIVEIPSLIRVRTIRTKRLKTRVLFSGQENGIPIIFVHGNFSSATWFEETIQRLPAGYWAIAPDLRGYGGADPAATVDARRGLKDFSEDLAALLETLDIRAAHLVGHSLGGGILWRFLADYPQMVLSVVQASPSSPYGFGCSTPKGTPCYTDGAGSGAAAANPKFVRLMTNGETSSNQRFSPRNILNRFVWKPPFVPKRIEVFLASVLTQHRGRRSFPGDCISSPNWPGVAPGSHGSLNALAPHRQNAPLGFCDVKEKPPILWVHGHDDMVVSNNSVFDLGSLGKMGAVPGWPGEEVFPPQPMVSQIARALDRYADCGGVVERVVLKDCGHSAYLEKPTMFDEIFHRFLKKPRKIAGRLAA